MSQNEINQDDAPLITIVIPCYNHEKYLDFCLDSIVNQNYKNIEIILSDDCSTDNSLEKAKSYQLKNMTVLESKYNGGPSLNTNQCIQLAKGDYIANTTSDDGFLPEKLDLQLKAFKQNPALGAVFTLPLLIDEENQPYPRKMADSFFTEKPKNCYEWLRYFFFYGNCLCTPSMLIKAEFYKKRGMLDPRYLQLQDFDYCIRLLLAGYDIVVIEEPLTYYRIRKQKKNLSSYDEEKINRSSFELQQILNEHYASIDDPELFSNIFPMIEKGPINLMKFDLARYCLNHTSVNLNVFGKYLLFFIYKDQCTIDFLIKERSFYPIDFYQITGTLYTRMDIGSLLHKVARKTYHFFKKGM